MLMKHVALYIVLLFSCACNESSEKGKLKIVNLLDQDVYISAKIGSSRFSPSLYSAAEIDSLFPMLKKNSSLILDVSSSLDTSQVVSVFCYGHGDAINSERDTAEMVIVHEATMGIKLLDQTGWIIELRPLY